MPRHHQPFQSKALPAEVDALAPDMSEIRVLLSTRAASMAHGTLPPGAVSLAVRHRTVEELWYVLGGEAEIWRRNGEQEEIMRVRAGISLTIPLGTAFQFRTVSEEPFRFLMVTMPPWPGGGECELGGDLVSLVGAAISGLDTRCVPRHVRPMGRGAAAQSVGAHGMRPMHPRRR